MSVYPNNPSCREQRKAMGLSYSRSNCVQCGTLLRENWKCAQGLGADADVPVLVAAAAPATTAEPYTEGEAENFVRYVAAMDMALIRDKDIASSLIEEARSIRSRQNAALGEEGMKRHGFI